MRDLYKRLGLPPTATSAQLREAAASAEDATKRETEFILLHPGRRRVYDRNHRLLTTIGELRGRLALGLRPFWSHGHHQDFTKPFVPGAKVDPLSVMNGLHPEGKMRSRRAKWMWTFLLLALIGVCLWLLRK